MIETTMSPPRAIPGITFLTEAKYDKVGHLMLPADLRQRFGKRGNQLSLLVPSGIGDSLWVLQKALSVGLPVNVILPAEQPQRAKPFLELIDGVREVVYWPKLRGHDVLAGLPPAQFPLCGLHYLSANFHLECGARLEEWYPEVPVTWRPRYQVPLPLRRRATELVNRAKFPRKILLFTATKDYFGANWLPHGWLQFLRAILARNTSLLYAAAPWDVEFAGAIRQLLEQEGFDVVPVFEEHVGTVLEVMRACRAHVGCAGGLGIACLTLGVPALLLFPPQLSLMRDSFAPPLMLGTGQYGAIVMSSPWLTAEHLWDWGHFHAQEILHG